MVGSDGSDGSGGSGGYTLLYANFLAYLRSGTFPSVSIENHRLRSCTVSLRQSDSQCRKVVRFGALGFQVLTLERHVNQRTQNRLVT